MKRIAVVGLYDIKNAGDNILCDATQYLIRSLEEAVEIVEVDVNPRKNRYKGFDKIPLKISDMMRKMDPHLFTYDCSNLFRYKYEYLMWWLKINKRFKEQLKDVDAIVFAGGGFLKFRTQGLNYYVEQIVKIAEKNNIPIMMNGVGIEGYDEKDIRCQRLKKAINKDVMKVITTRDDIETLQNLYIVNKNMKTARVGDPALWVPECYEVEPHERDKRVVGINVIRGRIYQSYGNTLSEEGLMNFYRLLIHELEDRGIEWKLFSNGMKADQVFGRQLIKSLGYDVKEKLLPAPGNVNQFIEILQSFDVVFGARLHACITSYALDIPVVGLIWSEKLRIFAQVIGKKSHFFEEYELNVKSMVDAIEECFNDSYDKKIRDNLRALTKNHVEYFLSLINE